MELLLEHRRIIEAAGRGRVWQDERGTIHTSRDGKRNTTWSRSNITRRAGELLAAGYLCTVEGSETLETTKAGREAAEKASASSRFPVVSIRVA